jgi:hypothetical protein
MTGDATAQAFAAFAGVPKEIAQRARQVMRP